MSLQYYTTHGEYQANNYEPPSIFDINDVKPAALVKDYPFPVSAGHLQKTYWIISGTHLSSDTPKIEVSLPVFFTTSINKRKNIEVRNCKINVERPDGIKFHSDIVKENAFDDHFICFANELLIKPRKYHWFSSDKSIKLWFSDMTNQIIDNDFTYHVDLLLTY
jgi:hypothetical protein